MWWRSFLKYTLYTPIALFVLTLITRSGSWFYNTAQRTSDDVTKSAVYLLFILILAISAHRAGQMVGGLGADAALNFGKRAGGRLARTGLGVGIGAGVGFAGLSYLIGRRINQGVEKGFGKDAAKWTGRVGKTLAFPATVPLGAYGAYRIGRDAYRQGVRRPMEKALGVGKYSPYDKEGYIKKGAKPTAGARFGAWVAGDPTYAQAAKVRNAGEKLYATERDKDDKPVPGQEGLLELPKQIYGSPDVGATITKEQVQLLVKAANPGDKKKADGTDMSPKDIKTRVKNSLERLQLLVQNKPAVEGMDPGTMGEIMNIEPKYEVNLPTNLPVMAPDGTPVPNARNNDETNRKNALENQENKRLNDMIEKISDGLYKSKKAAMFGGGGEGGG
jgi:hypothetical protein